MLCSEIQTSLSPRQEFSWWDGSLRCRRLVQQSLSAGGKNCPLCLSRDVPGLSYPCTATSMVWTSQDSRFCTKVGSILHSFVSVTASGGRLGLLFRAGSSIVCRSLSHTRPRLISKPWRQLWLVAVGPLSLYLTESTRLSKCVVMLSFGHLSVERAQVRTSTRTYVPLNIHTIFL